MASRVGCAALREFCVRLPFPVFVAPPASCAHHHMEQEVE